MISEDPDDSSKERSAVFYSLGDIPEEQVALDELELNILWETAIENDFNTEDFHERYNGVSELNSLLAIRLDNIIREKHALSAYVKHETITHSINYAHKSNLVKGHYRVVLYGLAMGPGDNV